MTPADQNAAMNATKPKKFTPRERFAAATWLLKDRIQQWDEDFTRYMLAVEREILQSMEDGERAAAKNRGGK